MTATYINTQTNETHKISGVSNIGKAWALANHVCDRMNWNFEMFAEDVIVSVA